MTKEANRDALEAVQGGEHAVGDCRELNVASTTMAYIDCDKTAIEDSTRETSSQHFPGAATME